MPAYQVSAIIKPLFGEWRNHTTVVTAVNEEGVLPAYIAVLRKEFAVLVFKVEDLQVEEV